VADDWRVTAILESQPHAGRLVRALQEHEVTEDLRKRLGRRVVVSRGDSHADPRVFVYADTEQTARAAQAALGDIASRRELSIELALDRWHPAAEKWEDPGLALPETAQQQQAEHEQLMDDELAESEGSGVAEWEVRAELASHRAAIAVADRLGQDGATVQRRWRYLLVGAADEDQARALAQRIEDHAGAGGAQTQVLLGGGIAWSPVNEAS
jgi:hypothetical protein